MKRSEIKVIEVHGGTKGTEYVYFIIGDELVHVSMIPGARKVSVEKWGGRRKEITWSIPACKVAGLEGLHVSFTRNSRRPYIGYFKLPQDLSNISVISERELYGKGLIVENVKDPIEDVVYKRKLKVRLFGPEYNKLKEYRNIVPKLIKDLKRDLASINISEDSIFIVEHAIRLAETLIDPNYALFMSLIVPTPQGRIRSLHEKITKSYELWLLVKVLKALHDIGAELKENKLWIAHTTNEPAAELRLDDKLIYVFYQPSLVPHIVGGGVIYRRIHAIPDIAIMISDREIYIEWGKLREYADRIPLLIEAKLSLTGVTEYESIDITKKQVITYMRLLNGIPKVIISIYHKNPYAVYELNRISNVIAVDDVNPGNQLNVDKLAKYVKDEINNFLYRLK